VLAVDTISKTNTTTGLDVSTFEAFHILGWAERQPPALLEACWVLFEESSYGAERRSLALLEACCTLAHISFGHCGAKFVVVVGSLWVVHLHVHIPAVAFVRG
jgi:hypothetical protein